MKPGIPAMPGAYLVLELTNRCQLRCTHCIQGRPDLSSHHSRLGEMDPAMVRSVLADIVGHGIRFDALILFWLGEPLLHARFAEVYAEILEVNRANGAFRQVEVHTNGLRVDEAAVRVAFAHADVRQKWHFTLDAATEGTYRAIKGTGALAKAQAGAERFIREKALWGGAGPQIVFQFVVHEENEAEAEAFRDRWLRAMREARLPCSVAAPQPPHDGSDAVFYRLLDSLAPERQGEADRVYAKVLARLGLARTPAYGAGLRSGAACSGPFKSPTVDWDGRVTACTRDSGFENLLGDLSRESFHEIWLGGTRVESMREAMVHRDLDDHPFCRGCPIPASANYTGITIEEAQGWIDEVRRPGLRPAPSVR